MWSSEGKAFSLSQLSYHFCGCCTAYKALLTIVFDKFSYLLKIQSIFISFFRSFWNWIFQLHHNKFALFNCSHSRTYLFILFNQYKIAAPNNTIKLCSFFSTNAIVANKLWIIDKWCTKINKCFGVNKWTWRWKRVWRYHEKNLVVCWAFVR